MDKEEFKYLANTCNEVYNRQTGEYEEFEPNKELIAIYFR